MLKVALVGLGVMGKNHYRVLQKIEDIEIVGLCDSETEESFNAPLFKDVDLMLSELEIDCAIIAVPTFLHFEIAKKFIAKGIPLLIEKPIAGTAQEGEVLIKMALEKGVKLAIGHVERFNPVVNALVNELKDKNIYSIQITRVGPFPPRIADVGVLTDLSVHDIDLIRYVSKREILHSSIHKSQKIHDHYEDNAVLSFSLDQEIVACIMTNWLTPFKKRKIEVATEEAYYEADLMTQELVEYSSYSLNNSYVHRGCFVQKSEPLLSQDIAFMNYVRTGEAGNLALAEDGLITMKVIER